MRRLTDNIKVEIFTLVLYQGVTITDCAAQYGVSRGYLSRVVNKYRREYQSPQDIATLLRDLEPKCWETIEAAISNRSKPYRAAGLALKVLLKMRSFENLDQGQQREEVMLPDALLDLDRGRA